MALYPVEDRFPLTTGGGIDGATSGPIPFGQRFFLPMPPATSPAAELSRWRYDRDRQVAVDAEGVPMIHGDPSALWELTSTGNLDGNEETKMDDR